MTVIEPSGRAILEVIDPQGVVLSSRSRNHFQRIPFEPLE